MDINKLLCRVKVAYPLCNENKQLEFADRLMNVDERLLQNIEEWIAEKPLTDIWVRNKYCVRAVMQLRQDNDFIDAVLSLNDYAQNASNEYRLWRQRL